MKMFHRNEIICWEDICRKSDEEEYDDINSDEHYLYHINRYMINEINDLFRKFDKEKPIFEDQDMEPTMDIDTLMHLIENMKNIKDINHTLIAFHVPNQMIKKLIHNNDKLYMNHLFQNLEDICFSIDQIKDMNHIKCIDEIFDDLCYFMQKFLSTLRFRLILIRDVYYSKFIYCCKKVLKSLLDWISIINEEYDYVY